VADVARAPRGLLDTSVVVDLASIPVLALPHESVISALTLAVLSAGPHAAETPAIRAQRINRLQTVEATLEALPFDDDSARAYGRVYAAVAAAGQTARGARAVDLMIASTAIARALPLYTRNPDDLSALIGVLEIRSVP
jgi:hypothetical protein